MRGVPKLDQNPIAIPILRSLTQVDGEEESKEASERTRIDFRLFVTTMAIFQPQKNDQDTQLKFLFRVYDKDEDGYIGIDELQELLFIIT